MTDFSITARDGVVLMTSRPAALGAPLDLVNRLGIDSLEAADRMHVGVTLVDDVLGMALVGRHQDAVTLASDDARADVVGSVLGDPLGVGRVDGHVSQSLYEWLHLQFLFLEGCVGVQFGSVVDPA